MKINKDSRTNYDINFNKVTDMFTWKFTSTVTQSFMCCVHYKMGDMTDFFCFSCLYVLFHHFCVISYLLLHYFMLSLTIIYFFSLCRWNRDLKKNLSFLPIVHFEKVGQTLPQLFQFLFSADSIPRCTALLSRMLPRWSSVLSAGAVCLLSSLRAELR